MTAKVETELGSTATAAPSQLGPASSFSASCAVAGSRLVASATAVSRFILGALFGESRRVAFGIAVGLFSLGGAALVIAQEGSKPVVAPDAASVERKLDQARAYVDRMRGMISNGFAELEEARKSQNVARVNCVSDALSTMKGLLRLAEGIFLSMQECGSRKDAACTEHEYVKVSVAFNKCEDMEGQLKGCGGPSLDGAVDGKPVIEKSVDSDIPDLNPVGGLTAVDPKLEVPPSASPFFSTGGG
ncbi:MAG: hypothetical protein EXR77_04670 [Myxococcales bacterium]|nr:hypothetical protein [Myxococcales bacterium]